MFVIFINLAGVFQFLFNFSSGNRVWETAACSWLLRLEKLQDLTRQDTGVTGECFHSPKISSSNCVRSLLGTECRRQHRSTGQLFSRQTSEIVFSWILTEKIARISYLSLTFQKQALNSRDWVMAYTTERVNGKNPTHVTVITQRG